MSFNCPNCKSNERVYVIGHYSVLIAIDDAVEITQFYCGKCYMEFEV